MSPHPPRLRLPTLEAGFGPQDLLQWLDKCEDAFKSHEEQLGEGETFHIKTKIREVRARPIKGSPEIQDPKRNTPDALLGSGLTLRVYA